GIDPIGTERVRQIVRRDRLVRSVADPRIGRLAVAALLELLEQIAQAATDDVTGRRTAGTAREQAAQQIAEAAAASTACAGSARRRSRATTRIAGGLSGTETPDRLEGEQSQQGHRQRRHSATAAAAGRCWHAFAARPVLHSVEDVEKTHGCLRFELPPERNYAAAPARLRCRAARLRDEAIAAVRPRGLK